ncbi:PLP-dependent aminotransferase family protein [Rhodospirillum sp. A1_3_36]|uniref:MocR-like pyridoxine biosynthesis transcription factor PdxR n=1 Tax=Rhodospirillum sp. A1_3_36 TaxID=3391666 RepID=UPI0039A41BEB
MTHSNPSLGRTHPDVTWIHIFRGLDRNGQGGQGLNIQIRRAIVYAIEVGLLAPGDRLPSSRQLATLLRVARNTVTAAYQMLTDDGLLVSRERSGIYVGDRKVTKEAPAREKPAGDHLTRRFATQPSRLRHFNKPRNWMEYRYPFLYGQFDPAIFPTNDWREAIRSTSSVQEICGWAGDLIDDDDPDLLEQLRVQVLPRRGIFAEPNEIIITIGSQQALSMLVHLLVGRNSKVGVEDPGYPDTRNMVILATGSCTPLSVDNEGVVPDHRFGQCDLAFLTVGHQCPTTAVMPHHRREALLEVANRQDVLLIEDDYEGDLTLTEGGSRPCLKSLDRSDRVIYLGSFSKALAPGLRIGYIVAPAVVTAELRLLRRLLMRHPPTNNQRILAAFIGLGHYQRHMRRAAEILSRRAALMAQLLPEVMPGCTWRRDGGGKSFWVRLPEGYQCRAFEAEARERGVLVEAGDIFFANPEDGDRFLRLGFTSIAETAIEPGLRILGDMVATGR